MSDLAREIMRQAEIIGAPANMTNEYTLARDLLIAQATIAALQEICHRHNEILSAAWAVVGDANMESVIALRKALAGLAHRPLV